MAQQAKVSGGGQNKQIQSASKDLDRLVGEMTKTIGMVKQVKQQADKAAEKDGFLGPNMKIFDQITHLLSNLSRLVDASEKSQKTIMSNLQSTKAT